MRKRIAAGLAAVAAGLAVLAGGPGPAPAQDKGKPPAPKLVYSHDLKVRPGGQKDFNAATPQVGVEVFRADEFGAGLGISDAGFLAVFPAKAPGMSKDTEWKTGLDLAVRRAGEGAFTQKTASFGVEVFLDQGSDRLLFVCQSGAIAFAPRPPAATDKGPRFHHGLEPKVRNADQSDFTGAAAFGVEAYTDQANSTLLYVTEKGSIAAAPGAPPLADGAKVAPPKPLYGLVLRVRRADEPDFTEKTRRLGVEVFEDPNANVLLYLSETGAVAAVPKAAVDEKAKGVTWKGAMNLRARKAGEKEFEKAKKYGIEVFQDNRTGNLVFVCETGSIAVLPK